MKKILFLFFTILMVFAKAQYVGINTSTPKVTFDVTGIPADATKSDGRMLFTVLLKQEQLFM